jgi:hypothetical protein
MRGLPLPYLLLKAHQRTKCFKIKLNTSLAFKITFDKERLPLLPIQLAEFRILLLAKTPAYKSSF